MVVNDLAVAEFLVQAVLAMHLRGRKTLRAVEGQQIVIVQKDHLLQDLAVCEFREDVGEGGPEFFGVDGVKGLSHLRVTGDVSNVEDHLEVLGVLLPPLVKGQQRRILQREHGETAHQRVRQSGRVLSPVVGDVLKYLVDLPIQSIGAQVLTWRAFLGHRITARRG